jgi:hypothetical protein
MRMRCLFVSTRITQAEKLIHDAIDNRCIHILVYVFKRETLHTRNAGQPMSIYRSFEALAFPFEAPSLPTEIACVRMVTWSVIPSFVAWAQVPASAPLWRRWSRPLTAFALHPRVFNPFKAPPLPTEIA